MVQESLSKAAEGPESFMEWVKEHREKIDSKFMAMLDKMAKYSQDHSSPQVARAFAFLKSSFDKVSDLPGPLPMAVTPDNFRAVWQEAGDYLRAGKPNRALHLFEGISLYLAQHPDLPLIPLLYANLGIAYAQTGQKQKAAEYLRHALVENLKPREKEKILANLGTVYMDSGDLPAARECYVKALAIAGEHRDPGMQIAYLNHLALIAVERKNLEEAVGYQEQSCSLAEETGNRRALQDSLTRLALLADLQGDRQKCEELCRRALSLSSQSSQT